MRVRFVPVRSRGGGFGAFGTPSIAGGDCPPSGSYEAYCNCVWPASLDPENNRRCLNPPFYAAPFPPWTIVGRAGRGLPSDEALTGLIRGGIQVVSAVSGGIVPSPPPVAASSPTPPVVQGQQAVTMVAPPPETPPPSDGILGIPKTAALVGAGVLGLGLVAVLATRRR